MEVKCGAWKKVRWEFCNGHRSMVWSTAQRWYKHISQIKERDIIKANDPTDNRLEHLNKDISQAIQTHRSGIWKEHLDGHWDHRRNTHILWKTINGLSNKKPTPITNNTITFKNYTAITPKQKANQFIKQFTNITKHKTKTHYRKIHRKIESLPTTP